MHHVFSSKILTTNNLSSPEFLCQHPRFFQLLNVCGVESWTPFLVVTRLEELMK